MRNRNIVLIGLLTVLLVQPALKAVGVVDVVDGVEDAISNVARSVLPVEWKNSVDNFAGRRANDVSGFVLSNPKKSCILIGLGAVLVTRSVVKSLFSSEEKKKKKVHSKKS